MQGIYTHIPETNYVPREHGVAAILMFLFMVLISLVSVLNLLNFYISTFRSTSMCAVPNMAVFCSSLTSWYPGMLLTYFLNVFEIAPVAPIITGITFVFTFHMRCISIVRFLYFRIFSAYYYYYYYYYYYCEYDYDFTLCLEKGNSENTQHNPDLADILRPKRPSCASTKPIVTRSNKTTFHFSLFKVKQQLPYSCKLQNVLVKDFNEVCAILLYYAA